MPVPLMRIPLSSECYGTNDTEKIGVSPYCRTRREQLEISDSVETGKQSRPNQFEFRSGTTK